MKPPFYLKKYCTDAVNTHTGNFKDLVDPSFVMSTICDRSLEGFFTGYYTDRNLICMPPNVTVEQQALIVANYLNNHPEQLYLPMNDLIKQIFSSFYPCKK